MLSKREMEKMDAYKRCEQCACYFENLEQVGIECETECSQDIHCYKPGYCKFFIPQMEEKMSGVYCQDCGEAMTEKEYSRGECSHCKGDVVGEEDCIDPDHHREYMKG